MKKLVILLGKSGTGKSTVKKKIMELRPDLAEVITCTTRPAREGEKNGVDYHFHSDAAMAERIYNDEMAECVVFNNWVYGTAREDIKDDVINIGAWNPEGAEILNEDKSISCLIFLIDAPAKVRIKRALDREENPDVEEIFRRYKADEYDFSDLEVCPIVVNNDGSHTLEEIAHDMIGVINSWAKQINEI